MRYAKNRFSWLQQGSGMLTLGAALALAGCAAGKLAPEARYNTAESLAARGNLMPFVYHVSPFDLQSFARIAPGATSINVYIEGDGLSWISSGQVSADPTPLRPLALELAAQDPDTSVIYLARPCQYVQGESCQFNVWTDARFSPEVIASYESVLDQLQQKYISLQGFHLIGYSGGGGVAALLAARRGDILSVRTVAGNLDTEAFVRLHDLTPMTGSLNPAAQAGRAAQIPQIHFVGADDARVPEAIARSYTAAQDGSAAACTQIRVVPRYTHTDGWAEHWGDLLREVPVCRYSDLNK